MPISTVCWKYLIKVSTVLCPVLAYFRASFFYKTKIQTIVVRISNYNLLHPNVVSINRDLSDMNKLLLCVTVLAGAILAGCGGGNHSEDASSKAGQASAQESSAAMAVAASSMGLSNSQALSDLSERLADGAQLNAAELVSARRSSSVAVVRKGVTTGEQVTVHRFWNSARGTHFYTASEAERASVVANLPSFTYEGQAFHAFGSQVMGLSPVHRFLNTISGTHFYTISANEKAYIEANIPELRYEGVAYLTSTVPMSGFVPTYRFFNSVQATHFYTRDDRERDSLIAANAGYIYEGVAYYVLPSADVSAPVLADLFPAAGESVPTTQVHVRGKVSDNVAVKSVALVMGNTSVPATIVAGAFSAMLPLQPGLNSYTIVTEDHSGNRKEVPASAYLGARVAGGGSHSGAIRNGMLYTVGRNNTGQLGFGNTSTYSQGESSHPTSMRQITHGGATPVSLMFNQNFSLMLDSSGLIWSWGTNASGQLGVGTCSAVLDTANRLVPTQVTGLASVVTIAAGYDHSLALKRDGTVWAFGQNTLGQLGDGTTVNKDCPAQVQGLPTDARVIQIAAGAASSYALDDRGRVWAWGRNQYGNLGQGTVSGSSTAQTFPVLVPLMAPVVMLANGRDHVLALTDTGAVLGWGLNASNQLTSEWASPVSTPAQLPALPAASSLRVWANGNSSWVMKEVGVPYRWGQRLGNANTDFPTANLAAPERVSSTLTGVIDVGPGASHWLVLTASGDFSSLGWSFEGSLGAGPSTINTWAYVEPIAVMFP